MMNRTDTTSSSTSAFTLPTEVGDDEVETIKLQDEVDENYSLRKREEAERVERNKNNLWTPSKEVRDFQLNLAHTHRKTWTVTGAVQETPVIDSTTSVENEDDAKRNTKHQRKILWDEETIKKNNKRQECPLDSLIEKEVEWLKNNPDAVTNPHWHRILELSKASEEQDKDRNGPETDQVIIPHQSSHLQSWRQLGIYHTISNRPDDEVKLSISNDQLATSDEQIIQPKIINPMIADVEVYLKHLEDKVALKILSKPSFDKAKVLATTTSPNKKDESISELLNSYLSSSNHIEFTAKLRKYYEPNPINETLRDRTVRCIQSVARAIREEVVDNMIEGIIQDILDCQHQTMDLLSKGVIRGILDVNEGNKRFLKASGRLLLLRGVIDDFTKNNCNSLSASPSQLQQDIEESTASNAVELLELLRLKVEKEKVGGLLSKLLLRGKNNQSSNTALVIREIQNSKSSNNNELDTQNGEMSKVFNRKVPVISILHEQGFLDMTKFESLRLLEKQHMQGIRPVKCKGISSNKKYNNTDGYKSTISSLDIDKTMGKISATLFYPDYENRTSILIIGTTLGRLLCYRIRWKLTQSKKPLSSRTDQKMNNATNNSSNKDSDEIRVVEFVASNRKKGKKGDKIDQSEILSIKCSPTGPSSILTLNKSQRVVLWSLKDLFLPIVEDPMNGTIKQRGIFSCFSCTDSHKSATIKYIERLGTIDDEELLYRFRMKPLAFELYGKDSLRPQYCQERIRNQQTLSTSNDGRKVQNKTTIVKVMRVVQSQQTATLQDHRFPTTVNFFGGVNERKQVTSLMVGCNDGELIKINLDFVFKELRGEIKHPIAPFVEQEFINPVQAPPNFIVSTSTATGLTAAPNSAATTSGNKVFREIFHWHRSPVIFLETIDKESCMMLSIDEEGVIARWCYDSQHFAGSCWFVPDAVRKLPSTLVSYEMVDDENESMQSLNDLFHENKGEQERFQQALQVSKVFYKEIPSPKKRTNESFNHKRRQTHRRSSTKSQKPSLSADQQLVKGESTDANHQSQHQNADHVGGLSPTIPQKPISSKQSARRSTVIDMSEASGLSKAKGSREHDAKNNSTDGRLMQKKYEVTTIYHPIQDEESDDLVQYEETAIFTLIQPVAPNTAELKVSPGITTIEGVPYVLKKKEVEWSRSFLKHFESKKGSDLQLFGRKLTADGLELVHLFRRGNNPDASGSTLTASGGHFVIASLNTTSLEFRFPLTHFSLSEIATAGGNKLKEKEEQLFDFACGPIMSETESRIVFILTSIGIKQFGLYTNQEIALESSSHLASDEVIPVKNLSTIQNELSFKATKLAVCPSQRSLILTADMDSRIEVILLQHQMDGSKIAAGNTHMMDHMNDNVTTVESPLRELLNLGGSFSQARLETMNGCVPMAIARKYSQKTIIEQEVITMDPDSMAIALTAIDYVLELVEEVVDIQFETQTKKTLIEHIFGAVNSLGYVPPTKWSPIKESNLDRLIKWRVVESDIQAVESENESRERELMAKFDKS